MRKSAARPSSFGRSSDEDVTALSSKKRKGQRQFSFVQVLVLKFLHSRWFHRIIFVLANLIFVVAIVCTQFSSSRSSLRLTSTPRLPVHALRLPTRIQPVNGTHLMALIGYSAKPKVVGVYFANQRPILFQRRLTYLVVPLSTAEIRSQLRLQASDDYEASVQEPFVDDSCKARYEWMHMAARPLCEWRRCLPMWHAVGFET